MARTIVVGVDGSDPSIDALRYAADLVRDLTDAELVVVHARHLPYLWTADHAADDEFTDLLDGLEKQVREQVDRELGPRAIRWRIDVREGEPSHVLCDVAGETAATAIVAGRRGWSAVAELVLGSVSNRLVHRSGCPVLLVR